MAAGVTDQLWGIDDIAKVLEDWEAADESENRGGSYHIVRRRIWPSRDIFVPTWPSRLHLARNLSLPNPVWGLSLR